ncbi:ATP-dependent DNA ligase [Streptomyces sp. NBC_01462]|uniref:ATP-dependent DNA ligase n=1 Tax=Streptomyces sp. NBC_01462 TaxID=2903876 RepID=UPI002E31937C|nr:ATP-dependent DNA ligase [Streptomyces sp. NBC_01462]
MEGVVFKRLNAPYRPGARAWLKYKVRETAEAIVGGLTGHRSVPRTLLLGRYDEQERPQDIGRTTTLPRAAGALVGELLTTVRDGHPWTEWSFSAGWGRRETLVEPDLVVEVAVDVARDTSGRWHHPARWHRPRTDLRPADIPHSGTPRD